MTGKENTTTKLTKLVSWLAKAAGTHWDEHVFVEVRPDEGVTGRWQFSPPDLIKPAEPLQVEAVLVVELDAFFFQQALLQGVAAIAG